MLVGELVYDNTLGNNKREGITSYSNGRKNQFLENMLCMPEYVLHLNGKISMQLA
jgi:hypothetical protein